MNLFHSVVALFSLILTSAAWAGPQYLDATGYAVSGYDVVAYHGLAQSPVGTAQPAAIPGRAEFTAEYNGARFAFANAENRDRFLTDPAAYAPQFDGHCAFGAAKGGKAPGNPNLWRIIDGKLYLNVTRNVVGFWEQNIPGNISKADSNWVSLQSAPAISRAIPSFSSAAPVGN